MSTKQWDLEHPEKNKQYHKKYYDNHKEKILDRQRQWRLEHSEEKKLLQKKYYEKNREREIEKKRKWRLDNPEKSRANGRKNQQKQREKNPEKYRIMARKWNKENRERFNENQRKYQKEHPEELIMRSTVKRMLKSSDLSKASKSMEYIGCSPGFFRNHLESLFQPGMTWENYGEWHVDHKIPLSWFPLKEAPSLMFVASHWTNLQPLWSRENLFKSNRYAE